MNKAKPKLLTLLVCAALGLGAAGTAGAADPAVTVYSTSGITWQPQVAYDDVRLKVSGPNGYAFERSFGYGLPSFSLKDGKTAAADGLYKFELVFAGLPSPQLEQALSNARKADGSLSDPTLAAQLDALRAVVSGSFRVARGQIVDPLLSETGNTTQDFVINDDLIVDGSACIGFDCVNGESFSFDTLRLKENNLRVHFDDTSNSASFPNNDWRIVVNDTANGGSSHFSVEDSTASRTPFRIEAGARTNALVVEDDGDIGIGTSNPTTDIHVVTGNTPTLRLDQDGSSGFTPQVWDVAGNETNFFIRDATSGSTLPFRIRPGAPTSSIDIAAGGNVGVGTSSPSSSLHVRRTNGSAQLRIEETNAPGGLNQVALVNNGATRIRMDNGTSAWHLASNADDFRIAAPLSSNQFILTTTGNLTITGNLSQGSSRAWKENFQPADAGNLLGKVAALPLYSWNYKRAPASERHLGPTAEEFFALFGLGGDDKHIAPSDVAGVALGAVQALNAALVAKNAEIAALRERLHRIEQRLEELLGIGSDAPVRR